jgi:hypothetical protein
MSLKKKNQQEQLWTETMSAIQDLEEVLKKSAPIFGKEEEEGKKEVNSKESPKEEGKKDSKEESESAEGKEDGKDEEMKKGMEDDEIEGDTPESSEEMSKDTVSDLSSLLEGKSAEELLSLISEAIAKVESLGLPERSEEDAAQAGHEIKEIKEDLPVQDGIPAEAPVAQPDKSPVVAPEAELAESLDPVFGEKDTPWLESLHSKLGAHLASRKEMEKTSQVEQPKPVMPEATAMMKSMMESMKKSFEDSIKSLVEQNKELTGDIKEMKKSFTSLKNDVDGVPATTYASSNAGINAKELAKSFQYVEPARNTMDGLTLSKKLAHAQRKDERITTQMISKAGLAKSFDQVDAVLKKLDELGIVID